MEEAKAGGRLRLPDQAQLQSLKEGQGQVWPYLYNADGNRSIRSLGLACDSKFLFQNRTAK